MVTVTQMAVNDIPEGKGIPQEKDILEEKDIPAVKGIPVAIDIPVETGIPVVLELVMTTDIQPFRITDIPTTIVVVGLESAVDILMIDIRSMTATEDDTREVDILMIEIDILERNVQGSVEGILTSDIQ